MNKMLKVSGVAVLLLTVFAAPGFGQNPEIDYLGYAWETGGYPPSDVGDELIIVGVSNLIDAIFGYDLNIGEVTFHIFDLISTGGVDVGGGTEMVMYSGGTMEIYFDTSYNADWGIDPPNATSPSTFNDGLLLFRGAFTSMTMFYDADGNGAFEGYLDGLAGEFLEDLCSDCAYTWGGSFTRNSGAQIPDGYDLQIDGIFELDGAVANEESTWGGVKSLYGN